jgi:hypothetical protein
MKLRHRVLFVVIATFFLIPTLVLPVNACTSIIVGKNVSATGEVILAQNEDNGGRLVMPQYYVPRMQHEPGEYIFHIFYPLQISIIFINFQQYKTISLTTLITLNIIYNYNNLTVF